MHEWIEYLPAMFQLQIETYSGTIYISFNSLHSWRKINVYVCVCERETDIDSL